MKNRELFISTIVVAVGINFGIGSVVKLLQLPIYFDAIGTIMATILIGWRAGSIAGSLSFLLMTVTGIGPFHIYFIGTQIGIAIFINQAAKQQFLKGNIRKIITGIVLGIVAAIISAPVIVYLFKGVEGNGPSLITAFLMSTGNTILESVLLKGLSIEPLDKTLQLFLSVLLINSLPKRIKSIYPRTSELLGQ